MGCLPSKDLKTNLSTDEPNQIVGSTMLQADKIVVLGDSIFLPTKALTVSQLYLRFQSAIKKLTSIEGFEIDSSETV